MSFKSAYEFYRSLRNQTLTSDEAFAVVDRNYQVVRVNVEKQSQNNVIDLPLQNKSQITATDFVRSYLKENLSNVVSHKKAYEAFKSISDRVEFVVYGKKIDPQDWAKSIERAFYTATKQNYEQILPIKSGLWKFKNVEPVFQASNKRPAPTLVNNIHIR